MSSLIQDQKALKCHDRVRLYLFKKKKGDGGDFCRKELLKFRPDNNLSPASISYANKSIYIFIAKRLQGIYKK